MNGVVSDCVASSCDVEHDPAAAPATTVASLAASVASPAVAAPTTSVLVVEDEEAHAEIIRRAFEAAPRPIPLTIVHSLKEAQAAIAESPPSLILTDLLLPDGRGMELLPTGEQAAPFPVVIMTSHGDEQVAVEAIKAGALQYVVKSASAFDDLPRTAEGVLREWHHILERRHAEEALQASERRYRTLYNNIPSMLLTVDSQGVVLSVNHFAAQELGSEIPELIGRSLHELEKDGREFASRRRLAACFEHPERVHRWESSAQRQDGSKMWMRVTARRIQEAGGQPSVLMVCEDVTEAHHRSRQLSFEATHDPLTSLINRREFERRLERALRRARTDRTEHALLYMDLDRFKLINDTLGHLAGDELLRQIGALLQEHVRKRDTLARLGGDEFAALIEHCSPGDALRVADGLRKSIAESRFIWEDRSFSLGVSLGMVPIDSTSQNQERLLDAADSACYAAKAQGRNRVHVYRETDTDLAQRQGEIQWVGKIHSALAEGRFQLCSQPIVPIASNGSKQERYELLLRMVDEKRQPVMPGAFLPAAERYSLIRELDHWVIGTAFQWLAQERQRLERLELCSLNLAGPSLHHPESMELIAHRLTESGVPPQKICFELSETAVIANLTSARRFIRTLKDLGCLFALDDFGSGFSSFSYLKSLSIDFIKIDGQFIRDIAQDSVAAATVRSINEISHAMGRRTIAEWVENESSFRMLQEFGVDFAQGHHIGRPRRVTEPPQG